MTIFFSWELRAKLSSHYNCFYRVPRTILMVLTWRTTILTSVYHQDLIQSMPNRLISVDINISEAFLSDQRKIGHFIGRASTGMPASAWFVYKCNFLKEIKKLSGYLHPLFYLTNPFTHVYLRLETGNKKGSTQSCRHRTNPHRSDLYLLASRLLICLKSANGFAEWNLNLVQNHHYHCLYLPRWTGKSIKEK